MEHLSTTVVFRNVTNGDITIGNCGADLSIPGAPIVIEEVSFSGQGFRDRAWGLVSKSLETFPDRAVAQAPRRPREEARRLIRRDRERQKQHLSLGILRESADTLLLQLSRGKRGYWHEVVRATIGVPSSNDQFLEALEDLGFFSAS